ncbi:hypothetical protein BDZ91DRAFT_635239, partial [Kalaharituber pfeilii]
LSDFCLMAQYPSYTQETVMYMKNYLTKFHEYSNRAALVQDIVQCNSSFNFPKLHLLSHYTEQVFRFGSLPQCSTEISEAMHKPLKDAYRRSNKVDATEQILDIYTRTHSMAMLEKNLVAW